MSGLEVVYGPHSGPVSEEEVADLYPWPGESWLRTMMVTTLDGAFVSDEGTSKKISSHEDRAVMAAARRDADVILIGARTLRAEHYNPVRTTPEDQRRRTANGQEPAPVLALLTRTMDLPWSDAVFTESTVPPLVLTTSPERPLMPGGVGVIRLPGPDAPPTAVIEALHARGLKRVLVEAGPTLTAQLVEAGLVDEMDLTISPRIAGTAATPQVPMLGNPASFELAHVLRAGSFLANRYVRATA